MPACLFEAYVEQMEPLRAESLLDAATAADYPGWGKETRSGWWREQTRRAHPPNAATRDVSDAPAHRRSIFTWSLTDGGQVISQMEPISPGMLKANLAGLNRGLGSNLRVADA